MTDTAVTAADVINAASDTLRDIETGALTPAEVERRATDACRELFGLVGSGPGDPLPMNLRNGLPYSGGVRPRGASSRAHWDTLGTLAADRSLLAETYPI
jgi:hypothetical protein